jgi:hypothetical protein
MESKCACGGNCGCGKSGQTPTKELTMKKIEVLVRVDGAVTLVKLPIDGDLVTAYIKAGAGRQKALLSKDHFFDGKHDDWWLREYDQFAHDIARQVVKLTEGNV